MTESIYLQNGVIKLDSREIILPDLVLNRGDIIGICGESGCGKSTLASVLSGYQKLDAGELNVPLHLKGQANPVQWIEQHPEKTFDPHWTIAQSLKEAYRKQDIIPFLLDYQIHSTWLERYPRQLSGGELQRINILRAMVPSTQFLICDEITAQLDSITQQQLWQTVMQEVKDRNIGLLIISHQEALLRKLCDRIIVWS
ncbi:ATP-binding cassette domain-containing protein [Photobacterium damselae]|uniref:ATP-binding cassette domain-containing protein n=1 Tax=Photobacterium damselae TaxID=38293 RepID=UPI0012AE6C82|nr:ATP-binding cassette domain-containing protein [Photobacterium damselae]